MATSSSVKVPVRLAGIQGLRGLAVLVVILVHLHHTENKYSHGPHLLGSWISFGISGVDIFLAVSGFVMTYLAFGKFGSTQYAKSYAYSRATRLYPMYMLLTAMLIPLYFIQPALFNASEGHQVSLIRSLLLIPDVRLPLIPVAWTLHHELYFYIVFGFMLLLPERHIPKAMFAWLVVTVALIGWGQQIPRAEQGAFERVFFNAINLDFILGMTAAWAVAYGPRRGANICLWAAVLWVPATYSLWVSLTGDYWVSDFWRVWVFGLPAAVFLYAIVLRELEQGRVFLPQLGWVGDGAYSIYLTHLMVLVVVGRLWGEFGIPGLLPHLLFMGGSLAIALGVGYTVYRYVEDPLLHLSKRFDPTRTRRTAKTVIS